MRLHAVSILVISLCTGCAGPTTPFGAIDGFAYLTGQGKNAKSAGSGDDASDIKLRFLPERQVLHGSSGFAVTIEDPQGVPPRYELTMTYNGHDVTEKFLSRAESKHLDPFHRKLRLSTKSLRLLASRDNLIEITYRRSPNDAPVVSRFLPPTCHAFTQTSPLRIMSEFDPPAWLIHQIDRTATENGFNPFYVAGLIAQESSFNPFVVSSAGALGLTQVTSLGEAEIIRKFVHWPRYESLRDMPIPLVKLGVLNGRINGKNEWRLDPALSIEGGVEYLKYLVDYWKRSDKAALKKTYLGESEESLSEVILASYNSGAARVSRAIAEHGNNWLQDPELNEARKYVRRIASYCTHLARQPYHDEEGL